MYAALSTAQWVVGKALAPVADGVLGAWAAARNFGPTVEALSTELLLVKATLEQAALKELSGPAMEMLLQKLRNLAHSAEDLLDELDYFRIHDELHSTYDAADHHGEGGVHDLALNARHTAKAVGKMVNCCPWQRAKHTQRTHDDSSLAPNTNRKLSRCMSNLGGMGKTTLIQHIYHNQQVQNHFPVKIWICVSFNFNLEKVLEQVKRYTPAVESEKHCSTTEEHHLLHFTQSSSPRRSSNDGKMTKVVAVYGMAAEPSSSNLTFPSGLHAVGKPLMLYKLKFLF
ncbi:disease resistance protein RGA2 isoform X2 [Triticum aestivum]|uniref:disease resistance protein RGA2 isoform X2 n=1 Tax=Triticum aestivum TaxID=4565 RepID=UPI001D00E4E7|nr:disease resistance protein RGA2-like isoform X2 [Triticum aestivum]